MKYKLFLIQLFTEMFLPASKMLYKEMKIIRLFFSPSTFSFQPSLVIIKDMCFVLFCKIQKIVVPSRNHFFM